ncbi:hypothetical protein RB653_000842 [Dictyostelium firmibasis]|uniref:Helicase ATP-binding domain-containing protein n=1 Tax=Dictyostelium firmibasis TaxID=79012 RepID=A0AAN7UFV0_9MYCE
MSEEGDIKFKSLGLKEQLIINIKKYGITNLTTFQMDVIKAIKDKNDNVIIDRIEGTGRSLGIIIGSLEKLDDNPQQEEQQESSFPQILMLLPTRELSQATRVIYSSLLIGDADNNNSNDNNEKPMKVMTCFGGVNVSNDIENLKKGEVQILLGTPGRILDLIARKRLNADKIKMLILDEVDETLARGFIDHLGDIINFLNNINLQIIASVSRMDDITLNFIEKFIKNPNIIKL